MVKRNGLHRYSPISLMVVIFTLLVAGCSPAAATEMGDPYTQVEGNYRVQLTTTPAPLQVGEPAIFIVTMQDVTSGDTPTDVIMRPILDMDMADGMGMTISDLDAQEVAPGQFHINTMIDHAGEITLALTLDTPNGIVSVRFPPVKVE